MNPEVTNFINELDNPWEIALVNELRALVHTTVPDIEERIQYKKTNFLKKSLCNCYLSKQRCHYFYDYEC